MGARSSSPIVTLGRAREQAARAGESDAGSALPGHRGIRADILVDEADTFLADQDELRGVLNAGHDRHSAVVPRCVGDDFEPKVFHVFGAVAIAAIGKLPDTLMDRSVVIEIKREALAALPRQCARRQKGGRSGTGTPSAGYVIITIGRRRMASSALVRPVLSRIELTASKPLTLRFRGTSICKAALPLNIKPVALDQPSPNPNVILSGDGIHPSEVTHWNDRLPAFAVAAAIARERWNG